MRPRGRALRLGAALALALALVLACSDGGPVGPAPDSYMLQVAGGDLQFAAGGARLSIPLRVSVRKVAGDVPATSVAVRWEVVEGSGAALDASTSTSDGVGGIAINRLRLGSAPGRYRVRASADGAVEPVEFEAWAVTTPMLGAVPSGPVTTGSVISLSGANFSAVPEHNAVLFDGIRGRVVAATSTELEVEVPACLPSRSVGVRVALGVLQSEELPLAVVADSDPPAFGIGAVRDVDASAEVPCVRLPPGEYLSLSLAAGTVGGGLYDFALRGLAPGLLAAPGARAPGTTARVGDAAAGTDAGAAKAWEGRLRDFERALLAEAGPAPRPPAPTAAASHPAVPQVGDQRSFEVLNRDGRFERVEAVARWVGARAVLYLDVEAPAGGLSSGDLDDLSDLFDEVIHPVVTEAFGDPSDLDGNERVVMLFTPVVNRLTDATAEGFVGGFFFGLDLLPDREHSNRGEIFYALVPDPKGEFGRATSRMNVLESVPAVLAHELQHMVHFNQRILMGGAPGAEALWLSEGMAHMAEDLVGEYLLARQGPGNLFLQPNVTRGRRFLADPGAVSLLIAQGQGSLAERGAGWLFVRYLDEHLGRDVLLRLSRSSSTGVQNVTEVDGRPWPRLLADWLTALYTDGTEVGDGPLAYPVLDLRDRLVASGEDYPLRPDLFDGGDSTATGALYSSSGTHVLVRAGPGGTTVGLGGAGGGTPPLAARFHLRVVRLR